MELPVISKSYELYKSIIEVNRTLQKRWRYGLALSLENTVLECLESLIMAKSAPKTLKAGYLIKSMGKLETASFKIRAMLEFELVSETKIFQLQAKVSEIGRMLGGWLKSSQ